MRVMEKLSPEISIKISLHDKEEVIYVSDGIESLTGIPSQDFVNGKADFFSLIVPEDRNRVLSEIEDSASGDKAVTRLTDFRLKDIHDRLHHINTRAVTDDDSIELVMYDVTEYYDKISEHNDLLGRYEQLMLTLKEAVWDWELESNYVYYSDRWYTMLGYESGELPNSFDSWKDSVHPRDLERAMEALEKHIRGETGLYECTYRMKTKGGSWIWVSDRGVRQVDSEGRARRLIGSHRDITGEKEMREHLEKMIITDEMTGLYNRRHYDAQIRDEILRAERYGTSLSIIMIDIDLFKQINDTYGHRSGDMALKELACAVKGKIRNTDSAFRTGGEEFIVIAPQTDEKSAMKAAERLRTAVSEIVVPTGYGSFSFTISLGITTHVKGDTYGSLNERADIALYKSKDTGRNRSSLCRAE